VPEGHSIHRLARQFSSVFAGERLSVTSPQGRFAPGAAVLDGHILVDAVAHGKQLFLRFDNEAVLRVHLGLYGAWSFGGDGTFTGASSIGAPRRIGESETAGEADPSGPYDPYQGPPAPVGAVRVRLVSAHGWADLRGPTACEVITPAQESAVRARLGPDPLQPDTDPAVFVSRLGAAGKPVGAALMDQSVLAGVGNVYRAEVLFRARLNPWRAGRAVAPEAARLLWDDTVQLMNDGVRQGRIITTMPEDRGGATGALAPHYVYKRTGEPCRRCGTTVEMAELVARKLYWCPACQAD
jgi:endonuclease-8/formamidopyrimidine-DNA glycosylase